MIIVHGLARAATLASGYVPNSKHAFLAVANTRFVWLAKRRITTALRKVDFTKIQFVDIQTVNPLLAKDSNSIPLIPEAKGVLDDAKQYGVGICIVAQPSK